MVFIKVMCVHRYFTNKKRNVVGDLLRMAVAKELGIGVDPISVIFSKEQVVYGPSDHVLVEVFIFGKHDTLLKPNELARGILVPVVEYFNDSGMATAKIACLVDTGDDSRGFEVSRM